MMEKVNRIAKNPLEAAQEEENEALALEQHANEGDKKNKKKDKKEKKEETVILEQTIIKIGALLALGFGEAGAKIIADNMAHTGDVDPMIPGTKVVAIFGFCDIRQFTDTTEVLQEDIMIFVNEIAEIVHSIVDEFSGAPNKNIGEAFLLVWKYPPEDEYYDTQKQILVPKKSIRTQQIADMSVVSFIKVIAAIKKSRKLYKYQKNSFLTERMPNYSVKMGFGLHVGWAIEGAIGSDFKIDASYLSPNVNLASRLEAATKQFGVPILISGTLYDLFTKSTAKHMRHIDTVTVKGSNEPMRMITCDLNLEEIRVEREAKVLTQQEKRDKKVQARLKRNRYREKALNNQIQVSSNFELDHDISAMRKGYNKVFYEMFSKGLN